MNQPEVTLLIPNYKTPDLAKLCLRSINRYTDPDRIRVIVVDNGSGDESVEYLRGIDWIKLVERIPDPSEPPALMHTKAMDLIAAEVSTPYLLSMHTDTIVSSPDWLDFLLNEIKSEPLVAGVGSWKLEQKSAVEIFLHNLEISFKKMVGIPEKSGRKPFLRSHCALYNTELFRKYTKGFGDGMTAGESCHRMLTEAGFKMKFIPSEILIRYLHHLNHATMILNPEVSGKKTGSRGAAGKLQKELNQVNFRDILADSSLDKIKGKQNG